MESVWNSAWCRYDFGAGNDPASAIRHLPVPGGLGRALPASPTQP